MAATVYGTAYIYGISATSPSNSQIVSYSLGKADQNVNEVNDGTGAVITRRTDDQLDTITLELKVAASFSEPAIGSLLTVVDAGTPTIAGEYMVQSTTHTGQSKDFKNFSVTAIKSEYLDLTP